MSRQHPRTPKPIEGHQVHVALRDGTRIDDCQLVSGRSSVGTLWLFADGEDLFISREEVIDLSPAGDHARRAA